MRKIKHQLRKKPPGLGPGKAQAISRRKATQEALEKGEDLRARAEELAKAGAWEFDIATRQQTWTETVYHIHELDPNHRPTVQEGINFYTPESRPIIERAVRRAMELGEPFDVELEITTAKGNRRHVHAIGHADLALGKVFGFFQDITERKRVEAELRASREELRALTARLQAAREEERTHVAREIHDGLAHELTGLKLDLAWLGRRLSKPVGTSQRQVLQEKVGAMMHLTDQASQTVQKIATDLRPVVLDSLGLCAATEWVAADFQKRTEIRCVAKVPGEDLALDRDRSTALFRILQESLTNIVRHASATRVEIQLWREANEMILTVGDNGRGIQAQELKQPHSLGLLGMSERATLLGGRCTIGPQAGGGTLVEARLPLDTKANPVNQPPLRS